MEHLSRRPIPAPAHRRTARVILGALCLLLLAGLWRPLPRHGVAVPVERTDSALYEAIIGRMARNESYYSASSTELRQRGYPTASVFNWRLPTVYWGLANARTFMRILLVALAIGVVACTALFFSAVAPEVQVFAVLMQVGAATTAFTRLGGVLPDAWAALLLALSGFMYARRHTEAAAVIALAALFVRELAAPYVVICVCIALLERRRRELAIWSLGLVAWSVFYAIHAATALQWTQNDALAHPSWMQFGGIRFVLAMIGFGGWLYVLPPWVAAFAAVLLAAAPWAPLRAPHIKAAIVTYMLMFLVVGQSFNQGWGVLVAPLWAIGFGLGLLGLTALVREAR